MKFYIASSFNKKTDVRFVAEKLKEKGYLHTYDWTQNERASTITQLQEVGIKEKNAVIESDFLVILLPAGKGSHIELGIALGYGKKVFLYSPDEEVNNFETTSTFYHLPEVIKCFGSLEDLVEKIITS